ncbi:MAG TPA: hypothetical protein ENG38_00275, partial [Thermoplasmatales archaeon]|nr:hypothetical protein [Thermoplasmatales archaeon]HEX08229.1 hypothetical protein [Thermoplasmatales archaeon]
MGRKGLSLFVVLTLVLTVFAVIPSSVSAATIYVPGNYPTIQDAINVASDGDIICVASGTYVEQLDINKRITIRGAGVGSTIIVSPDTLVTKFVTSADNKPIIYIHDVDDVVIENLTVDGAGKGNSNYRFEGVAFYDAGGILQNLEIKGIRDTPLSGAQHGVGVYAWVNAGTDRTVKVENCTVYDYQKNGMALNGENLYVEVRNCTVTGSGPLGSGLPAQNGIQLGWGATGIVDNNTVSNNWYIPETWAACGGLIYDSDDVVITNNTLDSNLVGVYYYGGNGTIAYNTFTNNKWAINLDGDAYIYGNTFSGNTYDLTYMVEIVRTHHFWDVIHDAVDNASDGDTIKVYDGVYYENLVIDKEITLQSSSTPIIDGNQAGPCITIKADNVVVDSLVLFNGTHGIYMNDAGKSYNLTIRRCTIKNNTQWGAVYLRQNDADKNVTVFVESNVFEWNGNDNLVIYDEAYTQAHPDGFYGYRWIVRKNMFNPCGPSPNWDYSGLGFEPALGVLVENNTFNSYWGIWMDNARYIVIRNNTLSYSLGDGGAGIVVWCAPIGPPPIVTKYVTIEN